MWAAFPPHSAPADNNFRGGVPRHIAPPVEAALSLPSIFPHLGLCCWVNSLLQALASIADSRWQDALGAAVLPSNQSDDLLAVLRDAVNWVNSNGVSKKNGSKPTDLMRRLEHALLKECGLTPCADHDVHDALFQILEAVHAGLLRRELAAIRRLPVAARAASWWSPSQFWPRGAAWAEDQSVPSDRTSSPAVSSGCAAPAVAAAAARKGFLELWEGELEETRVCTRCGLSAVRREKKVRGLSITMPMPARSEQPMPVVDVEAQIRESYAGGAHESSEGVYCSSCSVAKSLRHFRTCAIAGSVPALRAWRRLTAVTGGGQLPAAEHIRDFCCPLGSPLPCLEHTQQKRWFRIAKPPNILVLHMRRLGRGARGPVKSNASARYPVTLPLITISAKELRQTGIRKAIGEENDVQPVHERTPQSPMRKLSLGTSHCCFSLRAVISHLGTATNGHFLAHRRWADSCASPAGSTSRSRNHSPDMWLASPSLPPLGARWLLCPGAVALCMPRVPVGTGRGGRYPLLSTAMASYSAPHWLATLYRRYAGPRPAWVRADDNRAVASSVREALLLPSAYVLFYERSGDSYE